jgi:hypothetical protein
MGMDGIQKSTGAGQVAQASTNFGPNVTLMSPDDILAYVSKALGDIGDQLNDYKTLVQDRQAKAKDLRDLASELRNMQQGGDLTAYDGAAYNEFMQKLAKYKDSDPALGKVYSDFMNSYGGYHDESGKKVGTLAGDDKHWFGKGGVGDSQDMLMDSKELANALKNVEDAQSNLNSENELTMMSLQQLMQRRNQISQFSSNALNMMNEGMKSIIGNMR